MTSMKKINVVSLFSGAGGLDIGFESTGHFSTVLAIDWSDYCIATLEKNKQLHHMISDLPIKPWESEFPKKEPSIVLLENTIIKKMDLSIVSKTEIQDLFPGPIDVVMGGPPCQAFSVRNRKEKRGLLDEAGRGNLIFSFMELVGDLNPKVFLFENVMGLDRDEHGNLVEKLQKYAAEELGYSVTTTKVVASDFGVPQDRRRIIIVGVKRGIHFTPPEPTHGQSSLFDLGSRSPLVTVRDALAGLPEPNLDSGIPNHKAPRHSEEMILRFGSVPPGKQDPIRKKIRLHPDRPCPSIFSGSDTGGGLADIHPFQNRALTPRECARLQGFPDYWVLESNRTGEMYKLVANAVPPLLGRAFANQIYLALSSKETHDEDQ